MPQMAPIKWLTLFLIFIFSMILFNILNYYSYFPKTPKFLNMYMFKKNNFYWKW